VRHLVLGTAGHIDHGKSALVKALTGVDPDRLREEQRRGITIELGFADLQLDDERVVSFVDVPGHERFVRHMVAGATGIDAVLLVVAADQGVQPQTREHLQICSLLGVAEGLVILTKCDLVDEDLREVVALELRELLQGTFLDAAPMLAVSARNGVGLDALRRELASLCDRVAERPDDGLTRLPVDRSFVLRGFGAVVTGTLVGGRLETGAEVEVLPGSRRARIRGLQVHHRAVPTASAGRRTAVNLQGLDVADVPRGATLVEPGTLATARRAWARLTLLDDAPRALRAGGAVRLHHGTCERAARYRVLRAVSAVELDVELYIAEETVLAPGDRFILRRPAPIDTVGGGVVVDIDPPHPRRFEPQAFEPQALRPSNAVRTRLQRAGAAGCEPRRLAGLLGLTDAKLREHAAPLIEEGCLRVAAARWFDGKAWDEVEVCTLRELDDWHRREPLRLGLSREELRAAAARDMPQESWRPLLERLAEQGRIRLEGELAALAEHRVEMDAEQSALAERIEQAFLDGGLEPPELTETLGDAPRRAAARIVDLLIARGRLVRLHDGKLFHAEALEDLRGRLRDYAERSRTIDVADFKQLAGISRKNAIPLLEFLDAERTTRRVGNLREIL
jgi:selenocysteine-specific elongation factor